MRGLDTVVVRPPGEEEYSDLGYAVLGAALAAAAGRLGAAAGLVRPAAAGLTEVTTRPDPGRRLLAPAMDGGEQPAGGPGRRRADGGWSCTG
ncbi:hypothetical protein [Streptomyces sp. NPDC006309]|uniref:hypothetical protein n=1 Tax=Streptomyces sp. NPDC006309 TaxID=3156749 RepID=UPI0033B8DBA1